MIGKHGLAAGVLAALLLASVSGTIGAHAADRKGNFAVHGVGALTCRQLRSSLLAGNAAIRASLTSWILGYISAINRTEPDTYDGTPVQIPGALVAMVVAVCKTNETQRVETVAYSVLKRLESAKIPFQSPEVRITINGRTTVLRKETLARLEEVLIARHFLKGKPNGAFSKETSVGIAHFQKAEHLAITGLPDPETIVRALVELPAERKKR